MKEKAYKLLKWLLISGFIITVVVSLFSGRDRMTDKVTIGWIKQERRMKGKFMEDINEPLERYQTVIPVKGYQAVIPAGLLLDIPEKLYALYKECVAAGFLSVNSSKKKVSFGIAAIVCKGYSGEVVAYKAQGRIVGADGEDGFNVDREINNKFLVNKYREVNVIVDEIDVLEGSVQKELDYMLDELVEKAGFRRSLGWGWRARHRKLEKKLNTEWVNHKEKRSD